MKCRFIGLSPHFLHDHFKIIIYCPWSPKHCERLIKRHRCGYSQQRQQQNHSHIQIKSRSFYTHFGTDQSKDTENIVYYITGAHSAPLVEIRPEASKFFFVDSGSWPKWGSMKRPPVGYFLLSLACFLPSDPNVCVFQMLAPSHVDKVVSFLFPTSSCMGRLVSALLCARCCVQQEGRSTRKW